jgi:hypothetical protein
MSPHPSPTTPQGCALSSNVLKLQVDSATGSLATAVVVRQPWLDVAGWALPQLPPLITDILISLDDKWLFFSNWLRGETLAGATAAAAQQEPSLTQLHIQPVCLLRCCALLAGAMWLWHTRQRRAANMCTAVLLAVQAALDTCSLVMYTAHPRICPTAAPASAAAAAR